MRSYREILMDTVNEKAILIYVLDIIRLTLALVHVCYREGKIEFDG